MFKIQVQIFLYPPLEVYGYCILIGLDVFYFFDFLLLFLLFLAL